MTACSSLLQCSWSALHLQNQESEGNDIDNTEERLENQGHWCPLCVQGQGNFSLDNALCSQQICLAASIVKEGFRHSELLQHVGMRRKKANSHRYTSTPLLLFICKYHGDRYQKGLKGGFLRQMCFAFWPLS